MVSWYAMAVGSGHVSSCSCLEQVSAITDWACWGIILVLLVEKCLGQVIFLSYLSSPANLWSPYHWCQTHIFPWCTVLSCLSCIGALSFDVALSQLFPLQWKQTISQQERPGFGNLLAMQVPSHMLFSEHDPFWHLIPCSKILLCFMVILVPHHPWRWLLDQAILHPFLIGQ